MRVWISQGGYVDFGEPVWMSEEQFEEFRRFMADLFERLDVADVEEEPGHPPPNRGNTRRWKVAEYLELLSPVENDVVGKRLKRTDMSVRMQRGWFVPEFLAWLKKRKYSMPATKEQVEQFLKEREGE